MRHIFVTGATGFLGWDLVKNLLQHEKVMLYLLVRGDSSRSASERIDKLIRQSYKNYKLKEVREKIKVVRGDITEKNLGINESVLKDLYKKINAVYHCAALCEFEIPLQRIRKINVHGTKNMLDFAMRCSENGQFKSFHHVSTVAIMGKSGGVFYENELDKGQEFNNTYEQTKFEAEKLVDRYRRKGLSISVYRPSIITGDSRTGEVSNFQMLYQPLHIFSLGIFDRVPANNDMSYNLVPVDYVARAISLISSASDNNKNYHLTNPHTITLDFLLDAASSYFGFKKPKIIASKEFNFKALKGFRKKVLNPYLPYLNHEKVVFDRRNFDKEISGKGFSWPVVDKDLLLRLFGYCADVNYITRHSWR